MKKFGTWLFCVAFVLAFSGGCGMFGNTEFYQALAAMCMRCHSGGEAPAKANVLPAHKSAGPSGEIGMGDPHGGCPFPAGRR